MTTVAAVVNENAYVTWELDSFKAFELREWLERNVGPLSKRETAQDVSVKLGETVLGIRVKDLEAKLKSVRTQRDQKQTALEEIIELLTEARRLVE
jgi:hypothetical protein